MKSISFCSNLFLIWIRGMPVRLSIPSLICKTTCFQDSIDDAFFCEDIHNLVSNFFVINFVMDYKIKCHNRQRCLFAFPRHLVLGQLLSTCLILRFIVFRIVFEKQTCQICCYNQSKKPFHY